MQQCRHSATGTCPNGAGTNGAAVWDSLNSARRHKGASRPLVQSASLPNTEHTPRVPFNKPEPSERLLHADQGMFLPAGAT